MLQKDLKPGARIHVDHLESSVSGRLVQSFGKEPEHQCTHGSAVFMDAASGYVHVEHQVSLSATDTIQAKQSFERSAIEYGVNVEAYHSDNGVFTAKEFMKELTEKGQGIRLSGSGAHFQNGFVENGIKIVTY